MWGDRPRPRSNLIRMSVSHQWAIYHVNKGKHFLCHTYTWGEAISLNGNHTLRCNKSVAKPSRAILVKRGLNPYVHKTSTNPSVWNWPFHPQVVETWLQWSEGVTVHRPSLWHPQSPALFFILAANYCQMLPTRKEQGYGLQRYW